ncbi:MAG: redoxin family protein [Isosphaeraceae bacterium]|nr:redoxin family protein [Isosphaeraceae bacterium]
MLRRHPCALLPPMLLILSSTIGCSMTSPGAPRTGGRSELKTIASVGDRPLPAVTGEPGASVVAAETAPPSRRTASSRISGRVVDRRGRPVPNALVRTALGATTAGRVAETTTDSSGGFTLHGLRPGSRYTLIAEFETDDGLESGRIDALASESGLEIALSGDEMPDAPRLGAGEGARARSVSNRTPIDDLDEIDAPASRRSRAAVEVNLDDIPTSEEIEARNSPEPTVDFAPARDATPRPGTSGWRGVGDEPIGRATIPSAGISRTTDLDAKAAARTLDPPPASEVESLDEPGSRLSEDDGENPLPPAIDPSASRPSSRELGSRGTPSSRPTRGAGEFDAAALLAAEANAGGIRLAERDASPRPPVDWDGTKGQGAVSQQPSSLATEDTPSGRNAPTELPESPARATTWDELLAAEAGPRTASRREPSVAPDAATAPATASASTTRAPSRLLDVFRRSTPGDTTPARLELCRYDASRQKLDELRLPDADGRVVSFREIDADYVLLDFWGSWCRPCVQSIPHLVELQNRFGPRIKIVGIACEKGGFEERAAKARETATKLGVNYTVLVSSAEEFSPVLDALKIQGFPTMILVDRSGKVVWREQGAAPPTLARLDRVLAASAAGVGDSVRR